ncbi:hypothetical protein SAMN05216564_101123 [Halopenitus persicus]|uniref:Transposase n=1 Tax=Halopenitus persicus TaxID=1048396 RepID=A0A1H3DS99_9EURY|nr:hypothetical protein SAMN05216564_101123 [Halopenitus persicus]
MIGGYIIVSRAHQVTIGLDTENRLITYEAFETRIDA